MEVIETLASDKEKLSTLAKSFEAIEIPKLNDQVLIDDIKTFRGILVNYIIEQSEKL